MSDMTTQLTTRDVANRLDVSIHTVRGWIKKGWLSADSSIPQTSPASRHVGRYKITDSIIETIEQESSLMLPSLVKYVPREKARKHRRTAGVNTNQLSLPGL